MQITAFSTNKTLNLNGRLILLDTPRIMGILNVTPDSFYDGGQASTEQKLLAKVEKMISEGADIIDVGGYSSRPGADDISMAEETSRVIGAIRSVLQHFPDTLISVDTFRSEVARRAIEEGAVMINDISGGEQDAEMFHTVARLKVPYILMHMKGAPQTMTSLAKYENMIKDLITYFHRKILMLNQLGVKDVIVDPGFGFAKTREQNFFLLNSLECFHAIGKPLLVGLSRKSMVWKTLACRPQEALNGTTALHTIALLKGAHILRVHDVKEAMEVVKLLSEMKTSVTRCA